MLFLSYLSCFSHFFYSLIFHFTVFSSLLFSSLCVSSDTVVLRPLLWTNGPAPGHLFYPPDGDVLGSDGSRQVWQSHKQKEGESESEGEGRWWQAFICAFHLFFRLIRVRWNTILSNSPICKRIVKRMISKENNKYQNVVMWILYSDFESND